MDGKVGVSQEGGIIASQSGLRELPCLSVGKERRNEMLAVNLDVLMESDVGCCTDGSVKSGENLGAGRKS